MSDINKLFDTFPDYDVFTGKTKAPKKHTKKPTSKQPAPTPALKKTSDYGDGYGKAIKPVKVKSDSGDNFFTILFFPILIIWLEITLRLCCAQNFNIVSLLYLIGFSLPIAFGLTLMCTFGGRIFNRVLCNLLALALTAFYVYEAAHFSVYKSFFSFSCRSVLTYEQLLNAINDKKLFIIMFIIPFIINLFIGHKLFKFKKLRIPAKLSLIALAVLIQLITVNVTIASKSTNTPITSYTIYHSEKPDISVQERFGLLTMERLSAFPSK